jgi:hypothetical protein
MAKEFSRNIKTLACFLNGIPVPDLLDVIIKRNDPESFKTTEDTRGNTNIEANHNRSGTITVVIPRGSSANDYLSGVMNAQELSGKPTKFPVLVENVDDERTAFGAQSAFIKSWPEEYKFTEMEEASWMIYCNDLTPFMGGSNDDTYDPSEFGVG